jgi:hypothetical protein
MKDSLGMMLGMSETPSGRAKAARNMETSSSRGTEAEGTKVLEEMSKWAEPNLKGGT